MVEQNPSLYGQAEQSTRQVATKLQAEFDKWSMIHWLMDHFGGLVFYAAQRLLDRAEKTGEHPNRDQAIIESCPRLFNDCYGGYLLARQGLILQSVSLLRSAFETAMQAILFIENESKAIDWLDGKQIKPREIRILTDMPESERKLYKKLSDAAHPNYSAFRYFSAVVPGKGTIGKASFYGGWFAPKEAVQISIQFLWAQLVFLERFYRFYSADLKELGLLWRTTEPVPDELTWETYLGVWRNVLTRITKEHDEMTPHDNLELAVEFANYSPEDEAKFRQGFEDQVRKMQDDEGPTAQG